MIVLVSGSCSYIKMNSTPPREGGDSGGLFMEGINVAYKRTFIDVSPALSASLPRSNSMPSLRLDGASEASEDEIYIEDLDLDEPPASQPSGSFAPIVISLEDGLISQEGRTIMLRNIPNKLSQVDIAECINARGYRGLYDFLYAPLDFKSKMNLGYCFVNFQTATIAQRFMTAIDGKRLVETSQLPLTNSWSTKLCGVSLARIQGLQANIRHYRNNPVNELPLEFRPCLFDPSGDQITFPEPDAPTGTHLPKASRLEKKRTVTQKNKLFVGGLNLTTTSSELQRHFAKFGPVHEAVVLSDKSKGGVSKGFGFCTFANEAAVAAALNAPVHWIDGVSVAVRNYTSTISQ